MQLSFRTYGEGYPLILLHGLFGMSDNLTMFAKMLADGGYKVYLTDLRNHGHSFHSDVHDYPSMADDIAELVKDQQLDKPVVVGHSMGGKAALQYANDYPEMISKLVVIDIAPWYYPVHHQTIISALQSVNLDEIKTRNEADAILQQQISDYGTRQFLLKNLHWKNEKLVWRFNLPVIADQIESIGKDTWPKTPNTIPVCFIRGSKSDYISNDRQPEILSHYPNAKFKTIEGAGHWVHAEKPAELYAAVKQFLDAQ